MLVKRFLVVIWVLCLLGAGYAQRTTKLSENFDGSGQTALSAVPNGSWAKSAQLQYSGTHSMRARVPAVRNDSVFLESGMINVGQTVDHPSGFAHVQLRFKHICKVSPSDVAKLQVRKPSDPYWQDVPQAAYKGKGTFGGKFNANSYSIWKGKDSTIVPDNSWWQEEVFDLSDLVSYEQFQFRFCIIRGNVLGSDISYGWNLDDVQIFADSLPMVDLNLSWAGNYPSGLVNTSDSYLIRVSVKPTTSAPIIPPYLKWTHTKNNVTISDSVLMTRIGGKDSIWEAILPSYSLGTVVSYSVTPYDARGNYATLFSEYTLAHFAAEEVIIGTGAIESYYSPTNLFYKYSWSRQLYLANEVHSMGVGGVISKLAWHYTYTSPFTLANQTCYMQAVDDADMSMMGNAWFDPVGNGATEVWTGTMNVPAQGWFFIDLETPFLLPPGKNLLIYWDHQANSYPGSSYKWYHTNTTADMTARGAADASYAAAIATTGISKERPNVRLYVMGAAADTSVAIVRLQIPDTVLVKNPTAQVPVVVDIQNKGSVDLTAATIEWSLNGVRQTPPVSWTGSLPWMQKRLDTIGWYSPGLNTRDTIVVWVHHPNGVVDPLTYDDTLMKVIYGTSDIELAFLEVPLDTVFAIGIHPIKVHMHSLSGASLDPKVLNVVVKDTFDAQVDSYSLPLTALGSNQYSVNLDNLPHWSTVIISMAKTDVLGNVLNVADTFFIDGSMRGHIDRDQVIGTGNVTNYATPIDMYYRYSWSRQLYLADEIMSDSSGGTITKLAWQWGYTTGFVYNQQTCYMQVVDDTSMTQFGGRRWFDPEAKGATKVWAGTIHIPSTPGEWASITLEKPFVLPPNKNLMVYWNHKNYVYAGMSYVWMHTNTADPMTCGGHSDIGFNEAMNDTSASATARPNIKLFIYPPDTVNHSVKLEEILSPVSPVLAGTHSYQVVIRNLGFEPLTSCKIYHKINSDGVPVLYDWSGNLASGSALTVTLGVSYSAVAAQIDTIVYWVELPNNATDPLQSDDTLTRRIIGCSGTVTGVKTFGASGTYASFNRLCTDIENCGMTGKLVLDVENGTYYQRLNIDRLAELMTDQDTLVIRSQSGNANTVTFIDTLGAAVIMKGNKNIYFENITIISTKLDGIQIFAPSCDNIEVKGCKISANPSATSTSNGCCIYAVGSTAAMGTLRIFNNTFKQGYAGVYLNYFHKDAATVASTSSYARIVNNTFDSAYAYGVYIYGSIKIDTVGYNVVRSRENSNASHYGLSFDNSARVDVIVGNKIYLRSTDGTSKYGSAYGINTSTGTNAPNLGGAPTLVINNEIRKLGDYSSTYGFYLSGACVRHVNNSVYLAGTGNYNYAYYVSSASLTAPYEAVNNQLIAFNAATNNYAFYAGSAVNAQSPIGTLNNNNYYTRGVLAYIGAACADLSVLKAATQQNVHSVSFLPAFNDVSTDLSLKHGLNFLCPQDASVLVDIAGNARPVQTSMGCYQAPVYNGNGALRQILGLQEWIGAGQSDSIFVKVVNLGATPLTAINLGWSHNGSAQISATNHVLSSALNTGEEILIPVGELNYTLGYNTVKIWINNLNNSGLLDDLNVDDTISASTYICQGALSGIKTLGDGGDFATVDEAAKIINGCGVNGDITIEVLPGVYETSVFLSQISAAMGNHKLTITSSHGIADSVTIHGQVVFGKNKNVEIRAITIGGYDRINRIVEFTDSCSNITIRDCRILSDTTTISSSSACIYKGGTGISRNIKFIHNRIVGGYYGFYFYGGATTLYGTHITFDSNIVVKQYSWAANINNANLNSYSHNIIESRLTNTTTTWVGMRAVYCNGPIIGNKILQKTAAITTPTGLYLERYHRGSAGMGLIANNDIMLRTTTSQQGINIYDTSNTRIIHNSIYIAGAGQSRGIYSTKPCRLQIFNNSIVTEGAASYPIYITSAVNATLCELAYNNLYAPANIGYVETAVSTWTAWQTHFPSDTHSVKVYPVFTDTAKGLALSIYNDTMLAVINPDVVTDITGQGRMYKTMMGAYTQPAQGLDLMLHKFVSWNEVFTNNQNMDVSVEVMNTGLTPIKKVILGWKLNGVDQAPKTHLYTPDSLVMGATDVISLGSFVTANISQYDVEVWVMTINDQADTNKVNDTLRISSNFIVLAEWNPRLADTISVLTFDINAIIRGASGAPVSQPRLVYRTLVNGWYLVTDTMDMIADGTEKWKVTIPQQYYNSMFTYSLTVTDAQGNTLVIKDSTYIQVDINNIKTYEEYDLAVFKCLSPSNHLDELCYSYDQPLEVVIANLGESDYNYKTYPATITVELTDPQGTTSTYSILLNAGSLKSKALDTILVMPMVSLPIKGAYDIKTIINSSLDAIAFDDTLLYIYMADRISLPVQEDFSLGIPSFMKIETINTPSKWVLINKGIGKDSTNVIPLVGSQMLAFKGNRGAMTRLTTRHIDINQANNPELTIWYYIDAGNCEDYTNVYVTQDGGATFTLAKTMSRCDAGNPDAPSWYPFKIDLTVYQNANCFYIMLESMQVSDSMAQYIDLIGIDAQPDLAVNNIFVDGLSICDMQNKDLKVVLYNSTSTNIDYSETPTILHVSVSGAINQNYQFPLNSGVIQGLGFRTVTVATIQNFASGTYNVTAYIDKIDNNEVNDTLTVSLVVNPSLDVALTAYAPSGNCTWIGEEVTQTVTIVNNGNKDMEDLVLTLVVEPNVGTPVTLVDTLSGTLVAGGTVVHSFSKSYFVPNTDYNYHVAVMIKPLCNAQFIFGDTIEECVNMEDLALTELIAPLTGVVHEVGDELLVKVKVKNFSIANSFNNVVIWASPEGGTPVSRTVSNIQQGSEVEVEFTQPYTVPSASQYELTVYIAADNNHKNDTLRATYSTSVGVKEYDLNSAYLSQNIPNPAYNSTKVNYSVPTDGTVIFNVYSVTGQVLMTKTIDAVSGGVQSIDFDITNLAAGIYYYSMDYNGQKFVKKMNVQR